MTIIHPPGSRLGKTRIDGCACPRSSRSAPSWHQTPSTRGRDFEWAQPAIELKLRINLDALRYPFEVEADVNARSVDGIENGSGLDTLVGLDDHRNVQCEQTPGLHLRQCDVDALALTGRMVEFQFRRSDLLDPLMKNAADRDLKPTRNSFWMSSNDATRKRLSR